MKKITVILLLLTVTQLRAQQKADTLWKQDVGAEGRIGMLLPDGTPVLLNGMQVKAINPEDGSTRWETVLSGYPGGIGYYGGTPYLDAGGYVINPFNGAKLNLGKDARTNDNKPIEILRNYIFPKQNAVLLYGKVRQGVVEGNVDEVFCSIDYTTGKTYWTRTDMFRKTDPPKEQKKGLGGLLKQAGRELVKDELQAHEDFKNAGERFLTEPLGTKEGNLILPLNMGVFAIQPQSGTVVWKREYAVKKKGMVTTKTSDPTCVLSFNEDSSVLYISRADFTDAVDVKSGNSIWKDPMPSAGPASFLHLTPYGLLSLPTKDVAMLENKRIRLFDTRTGEIRWEIKNRYGVQSFLPQGDTVILNLQNSGDKESVNLLNVKTGILVFEKNLAVEGNIQSMKRAGDGLIVVADEEVCFIDLKTGTKKGSITRKKAKRWILCNNGKALFFMEQGGTKLSMIDFATGQLSNPLSSAIDFKGGENPTALEWYKGQLLISSAQNILLADPAAGKIIYQQYYKAPGRSAAGKILSGIGATMEFTLSLVSGAAAAVDGVITGALVTSDAASIAYELDPEGTNKFFEDQLNSMASNAKMAGSSFSEGVSMIRSISRRFSDTRNAPENMYMMSTDEDGDLVLIQVAKSNGTIQKSIPLKKRDKKPDYLVDESSKSIYYIPRMTLAEEIKSTFRNTGYQLYRINLN